MYYVKELCVKLVTYQKLYRDARSAKYKTLSKYLSLIKQEHSLYWTKSIYTSSFMYNTNLPKLNLISILV